MQKFRKIVVVTGSRAEYGLLFHILRRLDLSEKVELKLIVTGTHLSNFYAKTIDEIKADGFTVDWCVDLLVDGDSSIAVAKSVGLGIIGFADAYQHLQPDLVVLLGDRFEILAAAQAAFFLKIPIAHLHGGEVTTGSLDESIRHAITKLSSLHFVSAASYRKRVIQMGEMPERVFHVGAMGLENFAHYDLFSKREFEKQYDFKLGDINFLLAYHPCTATDEDVYNTTDNIISVLLGYHNAKIIVTGSNADAQGRSLTRHLEAYKKRYADRILFQNTLGQESYLSTLSLCDVIIGNSSSGIIEAPTAGIPTVNVGQRQNGRVRSPSVCDCNTDRLSIQQAVAKALHPQFRKIVSKKESPYVDKGLMISELVCEQLINYPLSVLREKKFFDIECEVDCYA